MDQDHLMQPGDVFQADQCGCSFVVRTGPSDPDMAQQAPVCCCGHQMKKQPSGEAA